MSEQILVQRNLLGLDARPASPSADHGKQLSLRPARTAAHQLARLEQEV